MGGSIALSVMEFSHKLASSRQPVAKIDRGMECVASFVEGACRSGVRKLSRSSHASWDAHDSRARSAEILLALFLSIYPFFSSVQKKNKYSAAIRKIIGHYLCPGLRPNNGVVGVLKREKRNLAASGIPDNVRVRRAVFFLSFSLSLFLFFASYV